MSTRKTFLSILVTGAIAFQMISVASASYSYGGQTWTDAQFLQMLSDPNNLSAINSALQTATPEQQAAFVEARRNANVAAAAYAPTATGANLPGNGVDVAYNQSKGCMTYLSTGTCVPVTTGQGKVNPGYNNPSSQVVVQENNGDKFVCNANSGVTPQNVLNAEKAGVCTLIVTAGTSGATVGIGGSSSGNGSAGAGQSGLIEIKSTIGGTTGNQQTQSSSQPLSDLDPNATSGSCLTLTSTTLRYQAKDVDNNGEVTTLQTFLNDNSYLATTPTGFFGAGTLKAVKAFQVANNLNPTGYVGPNTRAAIKTISCNSTGTGSATLNDNNTPVTSAFPAGCTSSTGFSRTTGLSCASAFPAGCDSASGYSVTTGAKCGQ